MKSKKLPGRHIGEISLRYGKDKPTKFYSTGIDALDEFTGGLPSGELTLIAARPGDGKTALAMQVVEHISIFHKEQCGVFSFEMTGRALVTRMILARTGLPSVALRKGELSIPQLKLRDAALAEIAKLPIHIDDSTLTTVRHVQETAQAWIDYGIRLFALDYMQLMSASARDSGDTRANFIGECSRAIKNIARNNDVPFIALSQLNREATKTKTPPTSANLKDSGDLEQVADNIILLHPDPEDESVVDFILEKWRNGPTGVISCDFDAARTTFTSVAKRKR